MNVREEKQGWVKVENINLHQELAEAKREVEILMQKYDMLLREKIMCMQYWKELMAKPDKLTIEKEVIVRQPKDMEKKLKLNFYNTISGMHQNKE